jgi:hypothetical protein
MHKIILGGGRKPAQMTPFRKGKYFLVSLTLIAFLSLSLGCSYKPAYLQESQSTPVKERWKVVKIDPGRLSADEKAVFEKMGSPTYVRFFRHLSVDRAKVYEWVYAEPIQLFTFMNGKKAEYVVLDENPSSLNEAEKNALFWTAIGVGVAVVIGGAVYYFTK